jgi:hypothetical protein
MYKGERVTKCTAGKHFKAEYSIVYGIPSTILFMQPFQREQGIAGSDDFWKGLLHFLHLFDLDTANPNHNPPPTLTTLMLIKYLPEAACLSANHP